MVNQDDNPPIKTEPRFFYGYVVVAVAFFIMLVSIGFYQSFGVFFKPMLNDFGWTRALTSGAFSLSHIVRGLMGILMGGFTDKLGARIVLTVCGFLIGSGFLLMSQINNAWQLYLFYGVIIGVGMAGVYVPILSTIARWFTKRRSTMTGIVVVGLAAGTFIMPPIVDWLIYTYDWRTAFIVVGVLVLVVVVIAAQFLKREPTQMRQLSNGESKEKVLKSGTDGFTLREAVYTNQFWFLTVMVFCMGFLRSTIIVHIVPHVTDMGFSPTSAANILAIIGGASILGVLIGGSLSDRIGGKQTYVISFILISVASLWLLQTKEMWMLYIFTIIFGLSSGLQGPLQSPLMAKLFGLRSHGMVFGATDTFYAIGAAVGPYMAGYIFDITGSYQRVFLISAALGIVGLIFAALLRPTKRLGGRI